MRIIGGKYRGKKLFSPQENGVRPTSDRARESVFNILNSMLPMEWSEYRLADLFAGTGAFALEALSRGVSTITMVDINTSIIKKNAALFPIEKEKIKIITADAAKLGQNLQKYNLLFMDAPYNKGLSELALLSLSQNDWLEDGAICIVETEKKEKLPLPAGFELTDERIYGLAKISFLVYSSNLKTV